MVIKTRKGSKVSDWTKGERFRVFPFSFLAIPLESMYGKMGKYI